VQKILGGTGPAEFGRKPGASFSTRLAEGIGLAANTLVDTLLYDRQWLSGTEHGFLGFEEQLVDRHTRRTCQAACIALQAGHKRLLNTIGQFDLAVNDGFEEPDATAGNAAFLQSDRKNRTGVLAIATFHAAHDIFRVFGNKGHGGLHNLIKGAVRRLNQAIRTFCRD